MMFEFINKNFAMLKSYIDSFSNNNTLFPRNRQIRFQFRYEFKHLFKYSSFFRHEIGLCFRNF
jgi:hypothetical protein